MERVNNGILLVSHEQTRSTREITSFVIIVIIVPADDTASPATQRIHSREMLLSLPLRVHLLWCVEDCKVAHTEVIDSSVMGRIWTVDGELRIKRFPVHWAPSVGVRRILCRILCRFLLISNQLIHFGWLLFVVVMMMLLGQKTCHACLGAHREDGQAKCCNDTSHGTTLQSCRLNCGELQLS